MKSEPDGVYVGIQFAQANDGLKIEEIAPKSPAEKAGLKAGDIIVGVNGRDLRDTLSFMPLLKTLKIGDVVAFKARRGEEYREFKVTMGRRHRRRPRATSPRPKPTTATECEAGACNRRRSPAELKKAG